MSIKNIYFLFITLLIFLHGYLFYFLLAISVSNDLNISPITLINVYKTLQGEEKVKANQFRYVCATILRTNEYLAAYRRLSYHMVKMFRFPKGDGMKQICTLTHIHMRSLSLFKRTYKHI